jgi:hypothetical protein
MSIKILDGGGSGIEARVDPTGRLFTVGVAEEPIFHAAMQGVAYVMLTPIITLTSANPSALFYIKNTDPGRTMVLGDLTTFLGASDSPGDVHLIAYKNPTTGTLISAPSSDIVPGNRNFATATPALVVAYAGEEAKTLTNGVEIIGAIVQDKAASPVVLNFALPNGTGFGVTATPPTGNTSMDIRMRLSFYYDTAHLDS